VRRFTLDLACGAIGVKADQRQAIAYAHQFGFESVDPSAVALEQMPPGQRDELVADLKSKNLVWGAAGLPVDFRRDNERFRAGLAKLPGQAEALRAAGATRVGTWLSPAHNELTYVANFRQHAARLREVAKVLGDRGLRFGLEYVGPKTSWTARRHPFIHTMAEAKDLLAEIGQPNVGLVLDSWHWYTAGETGDDLLTLTNKDVVACDLNDAPAGLPLDKQVDNRRELPMATGVIDLATFLGALVKIGYDGPVRAEPFNQPLRAMPTPQALAATAAAMKKAFALVK
jgi:sugar phosphate isomerase/epimerase